MNFIAPSPSNSGPLAADDELRRVTDPALIGSSGRELLTEQAAVARLWIAFRDLAPLASSTPVVVFAHVPLWAVYPEWGWGTDDSEQAHLMIGVPGVSDAAITLRVCAVENAFRISSLVNPVAGAGGSKALEIFGERFVVRVLRIKLDSSEDSGRANEAGDVVDVAMSVVAGYARVQPDHIFYSQTI